MVGAGGGGTEKGASEDLGVGEGCAPLDVAFGGGIEHVGRMPGTSAEVGGHASPFGRHARSSSRSGSVFGPETGGGSLGLLGSPEGGETRRTTAASGDGGSSGRGGAAFGRIDRGGGPETCERAPASGWDSLSSSTGGGGGDGRSCADIGNVLLC